MDKNHKLALYIGYFLAKFNKEAYRSLKLGNQASTHLKIGEILKVKSNTIMNMRDEFDPLFDHRAGWHQRPMSPSRIQVVELLKDYSFIQLYALINDILLSKGESSNALEISSAVNDDENNSDQFKRAVTSRGITGAKAESFFRNHFMQIFPNFNGHLIDTTLDGVGYDFKNSHETIYIEVKGSSSDKKDLLLTDKEWEAAKRYGDRYHLVLIYLINDAPTFLLVKNPAHYFSPNLSVQRTIALNWNISHAQMETLKSDSKKLIID